VVLSGVGNRAAHNLIHDCPRFGVLYGGNDQTIELNHIRHVDLETADTGATYSGGRDWLSPRGTVIRYNYLHDIFGYGKEHGSWVSPHYAWGIYLDDNSAEVHVVGNIVVGALRGLLHFHCGRDNLVENNIFVDGKLQQIEMNGWPGSGQQPTVAQQGDVLPGGTGYASFCSISANAQGKAALNFSYSSTSSYYTRYRTLHDPGVHAAGQMNMRSIIHRLYCGISCVVPSCSKFVVI